MHFPIPSQSGVSPVSRESLKLDALEAIRLFGFLAASSFLVAGGAAVTIYAMTSTGGDFGAAASVLRRTFGGEGSRGGSWWWSFSWTSLSVLWLCCGAGLARRARARGRFLGAAEIEYIENGLAMRLRADLAFLDVHGMLWSAPRGSVCRGNALPSEVWKILGPPLMGAHREASIIHEHYCQMQAGVSHDVHEMFYEACLARGVPEPIARMALLELVAHGPFWERG
jgi:hypothetical protein